MNTIASIIFLLSLLSYLALREIFIEDLIPESNKYFKFIKKHKDPIGFCLGFIAIFSLVYLFSQIF